MKTIDLQEEFGKGYNRFLTTKRFYRVVKGSRGSKKSKNIAQDFILKMLKYKWANLVVIRRIAKDNRKSTYADLKWAARKLKVYDQFEFLDGFPEIRVKETGQRIYFIGLNDELSATSLSVETGALSWAWFEEAYQIEDPSKFDTVVESIRGTYPDPEFYKQITVSFNPWSEHHWLKSRFFDKETRVDNLLAMTSTYKCNEWLDETDRKRYEDLYRTNPRRARVVCDGQWGITDGLVYENYVSRDFDPTQIDFNYQGLGLDFGFTNDPTALIEVGIRESTKEIFIFNEHYGMKMLTDDIYNLLVTNGYKSRIIDAEPASGGDRIIAELKNKGVPNIQKAKKPEKIVGINFLQSYTLVIHPSCINTLSEISMYGWQTDKNGQTLNKPQDGDDHLMDALRYAIERYRRRDEKQINRKTIKRLKTLV